MKIGIFIFINMAPHQKLVLAPGAIIRGNTVRVNIVVKRPGGVLENALNCGLEFLNVIGVAIMKAYHQIKSEAYSLTHYHHFVGWGTISFW